MSDAGLPPIEEALAADVPILVSTVADREQTQVTLQVSALQRRAKAIASNYTEGETPTEEDLQALAGAGILSTLIYLIETADAGEFRNATEAVAVLKGLTGFAGHLEVIAKLADARQVTDPEQRKALLRELNETARALGRSAPK